jgi:hypothetical protein
MPPPSLSHMFLINHNLDVNIPLDQVTGAAPKAVDHVRHVTSRMETQGEDFLVSDFPDASTTNGVPSILANSNGCAPFSGGKATSFVMIDFVDIGKGMEAVDILNGFSQ